MIKLFTFLVLLSGCAQRDTSNNKVKISGAEYGIFKNTPAWELARSVSDGNMDAIRSIVRKDKNIANYRDPVYKKTLLLLAVEHKNYNSVKTLLELGANPNIQSEPDGTSALMAAAKLGMGGFDHSNADPRFLIVLLKYGGDPNAVQKGDSIKGNKTYFTPLIFACLSRVPDYVKILVDAGADINFYNKYGFSPLYAAIVGGNPDIVMYLLEKGADFKRPLYTTVKGEKKYILDALNVWNFEKGSELYKKQEKVRGFLSKKGIK